MYQKLLLCSLCAAFPLLLPAAPETAAGPQPQLNRKELDPALFADREAAETLLKERRELILKMHRTRMELIRKDPKLKRIHAQITALYRELALELDSKREMTLLNDDLRSLDAKIDSLQKK